MAFPNPIVGALETLADILPAGALLLTPVYNEGHDVVDFAFRYLNPAAQQLLGQPAHLLPFVSCLPRTSQPRYWSTAGGRTWPRSACRLTYLTGPAQREGIACLCSGRMGTW